MKGKGRGGSFKAADIKSSSFGNSCKPKGKVKTSGGSPSARGDALPKKGK
jgi:hypothetical protein